MIIAIIPARSGSKGFANKNLASINGLSIMERAIRKALQSNLISDVFISTDSKDYEDIAIKAGASSLGLRPKHLSKDSSSTPDVVKHLLENEQLKNVTHIALLQPTSPIRTIDLIDSSISLCLENNQSVVSVSKIEDPHPYKLKKLLMAG